MQQFLAYFTDLLIITGKKNKRPQSRLIYWVCCKIHQLSNEFSDLHSNDFCRQFMRRNSRKLKINHIKFKPLLTDNQVHSKKH